MEPYHDESDMSRASTDSGSSFSSTSAVLECIYELDGTNGDATELKQTTPLIKDNGLENKVGPDEEEAISRLSEKLYPSTTTCRVVWILCGLCLAGWLVALFLFLGAGVYNQTSSKPHDPQATVSRGSGKAITFNSVLSGAWYPRSRSISWVTGLSGEDGMVLEKDIVGKDYLVVEDIRSFDQQTESHTPHTLMKDGAFMVGGDIINPSDVFPSPDLKKVLVMSDKKNNWRHSSTGRFWVFDVETQRGEPLDPANPQSRVQLATWSPNSDSIVFTRGNNMYLRQIAEHHVIQITEDGGADLFYGVPDWVYEEEVFSSNSATWWSENGDYIAFLRTNESQVKEYSIQYVLQRPSGAEPPKGLENYPETRKIKYPKAGSPNPIVELKFYDITKREVFDVTIDGDYSDGDRLITEVVWAGRSGKILIKETNRVSDTLMVVLIDVQQRSGKSVRYLDVKAFDDGWFEITQSTTFVPNDPTNGRPYDGYIDTVIRDGYDHLAYFSPLDSSDPLYLTQGEWEVVDGPSAIDLGKNLVYFVAAKRAPGQRHIYSVRMDGSDFKPIITDDSQDGYYDVSFSKGAGYVLLSYRGPNIPTQKVTSTPSLKGPKFETIIEDNPSLRKLASQHELPVEVYSTIEVDGLEVPVLERRPPHFNEKKKYPVVFQQYQGPGSQSVDKKFGVDFQSYLASNLGYVVVTVDGRGTGFKGRRYRCITRGNIGAWEAHDQIAAAKIWAHKKYVDAERIAIWGWSYGGFMTLKVLEMDAGQTFKYGVAVAPVTDWRFYDSIYTERYMFTPQDNPRGYENSSITNVTALGSNVRFLMMHGSADDNVHYQNSLVLLDRLDIHNIENYDFHTFPDSDHSIYFHNANPMVFGSKYLTLYLCII